MRLLLSMAGGISQQWPSLQLAPLVVALAALLAVVPSPSNQVPAKQQRRPLSDLQLEESQLEFEFRQQQLLSQQHQQQQQQPTKLQQQQITALPLALALASAAQNDGQQHPDAPKLSPLSALERYQEGADLRLFCSASAPVSAGRLHFEWRKNQNEPLQGSASGGSGEQAAKVAGRKIQISMVDESASVLRIHHLEAEDSGNYTCLVRNQHGFDSSAVRVNVNVRLKWVREPPAELQVRAGKSVQLECDASGQPQPVISWTSLKDHQTIVSKVLRIDKAQVNDSGLYECRAGYPKHLLGLVDSLGAQTSPGEHLRKVVRLTVNGK